MDGDSVKSMAGSSLSQPLSQRASFEDASLNSALKGLNGGGFNGRLDSRSNSIKVLKLEARVQRRFRSQGGGGRLVSCCFRAESAAR
eukprot:8026711-Pyramimonas_sp.AAC.1